MPSLQPTYLANLRFGAAELSTIQRLGEARGRQDLFTRQFPEQLDTLRTHATIESTESSNRIEGVVAAPGRVADLVVRRTEPRNRSEQEIAGYRDALQLIHESHADMRFAENVVLQLHHMLYRYQPGAGGRWKSTDNQIVERDGGRDGRARSLHPDTRGGDVPGDGRPDGPLSCRNRRLARRPARVGPARHSRLPVHPSIHRRERPRRATPLAAAPLSLRLRRRAVREPRAHHRGIARDLLRGARSAVRVRGTITRTTLIPGSTISGGS